MNHPYLKYRIIIADDHELIRDGLNVMISKIPQIEIIAEASNGEQLLQLTRKLTPDVILTDVRMPVMGGIEATTIIKNEFPHIGVLALSSFDEEGLIVEMLNAGANGYLIKNAGKKEIMEAVAAAAKGETYYCKITNQKLAQLVSKGSLMNQAPKPADKFTSRELDVIRLLCEGLSSKLIAKQLGLKSRTVDRYREDIMKKMEVPNTAAVVMYAVRHGLLDNEKK